MRSTSRTALYVAPSTSRSVSSWLAGALLGLTLLAASSAPAQTPEPAAQQAASAVTQTSDQELDVNRRARALTDRLMSPWCPGTVTQCTSSNAVQAREQVRQLLRDGVSEADIEKQFGAVFGEEFIGTPKGKLGWLLPAMVVAFGGGLLLIVMRRMTLAAPSDTPNITSDQYRRLEAELDEELAERKAKDGAVKKSDSDEGSSGS